MKKFKCIDRTDNLCDSCINHITHCEVDLEFGEGTGGDNVVECNGYSPMDEMPEGIEVVNE